MDKKLSIEFGMEQEHFIDHVLERDTLKGHLVSVEKTIVPDGGIRYQIEFDDPYFYYLFGHEQAGTAFEDILRFMKPNPIGIK